MLKPAIFTPSGSWWTRTKSALFTAYVNLHLRAAERQPADLYVQLDRLEAR